MQPEKLMAAELSDDGTEEVTLSENKVRRYE